MDILADNCHINLDMPHLERSTTQSIIDWSADFWSTATNPKVMREVGHGAKDQVSTTSGALETLGAVALGAGIRTVGAALASAPAASYLAGREAAITVIHGPEAAADDIWAHITSPFESANDTLEAARVVAHNNHPDSQEARAARRTLHDAGASATTLLAMGIGGASGDLGAQTIRQGANLFRAASLTVARASFGEPVGLELQTVLGTLPPVASVPGTGHMGGVFTAPHVVAAGELLSLHHESPDMNGGRTSDVPGGKPVDVPVATPNDIAPRGASHQFPLGAVRDANGQITAINGPATVNVERDSLGRPDQISITAKKRELTRNPSLHDFQRVTKGFLDEQNQPRDPNSLLPGMDGKVSIPSDIMHLTRRPGTDIWTGTSKGVRGNLNLENVTVKPEGVEIIHSGGGLKESFHADGSYTYESKTGHRYTIADNGLDVDPKNWRITEWQNAKGLRVNLSEKSIDTAGGTKVSQTTIDFSNGEKWVSKPGSERQWTITDKNGTNRQFEGRIDFAPEDQSFSVPSIFGLGEVPGRAVPRTGKPYSLKITEEPSSAGAPGRSDASKSHDREFHADGSFTETSTETTHGRFEKRIDVYDEHGEPEHRVEQLDDLKRSFYGEDSNPYEIELEGSDGRVIAQPDPAKHGAWVLHVANRAPDQPWLTVPAKQFRELGARGIEVGNNQIKAQLDDGTFVTYTVKHGDFSAK